MITLYDHQQEARNKLFSLWNEGIKNVCVTLPTGAGKTLVMADVAKTCLNQGGLILVFAHRDVLLAQISDALCMLSVHHRFLASKSTVGEVTTENLINHGDSYYAENSNVILVSVNTFYRRLKAKKLDLLISKTSIWMMDEAHHTINDTIWGRCVNSLPHAYGLGVTATPIRADGKGLGRHHDGVFDEMFVGADMGSLIKKGRLSPYRIFVPPMLVDTSEVNVTPGGDYNNKQLAEATDKSNITGDAVQHYKRIANGKQAITFTVNIEHSIHVAKVFNEQGVHSVALSSKTPQKERHQAVRDFKLGKIKNLVNCDLFGEGFDVPAVQVVIMLRKTMSYSIFKQQFGRALRVIEGKDYGILIDHVGNTLRHCVHGYPHDDPEWTLDRRTKRKANDDGEKPKGMVCLSPTCMRYFVPESATDTTCPYCGHVETETNRMQRQQDFQAKEGVLVEMEIGFINELITERTKIDEPVDKFSSRLISAPQIVRNSAINNHVKRQAAQIKLRSAIQDWCHLTATQNRWDIKTTQLEFERVFKTNILKAQTLSSTKASELLEKIRDRGCMQNLHVVY